MAKYQGLKGCEDRGDASYVNGAKGIKQSGKGLETYGEARSTKGYDAMGSAKQPEAKHGHFESLKK